MSPDEAARLIGELYPAVYHRLQSRWGKGERRPTAETLAVLTHLERAGPLTVTEAARHFRRAQRSARWLSQWLLGRCRGTGHRRR